jgi:hypothetical protein
LLSSTHQGDAVTWDALDMRQILSGYAEWAYDSAPDNSEDGTDEEQATYWIWANDDGTIPIGGTGSEWR